MVLRKPAYSCLQNVIAHRGGQYFVDKYSVDKKHFGRQSHGLSHGRPHSSSSLFDKNIRVKRFLKKFADSLFWLKP